MESRRSLFKVKTDDEFPMRDDDGSRLPELDVFLQTLALKAVENGIIVGGGERKGAETP